MPLSRLQFIERIIASGVMTADEVRGFDISLAGDGPRADAQEFAKMLVRHRKLTKYQAAAIYQGKTAGLVLGNYVILDKIGAGGMGQVFKALHRRMERVVALKVLPAEAMKSPDNIQRFHREVKAAARLEHPNIVTAYDADEADGVHFLVMQYVEGSDLSELLKKNGPFPVPQAVECIRQAALGLAYAHAHGVVHRDIKPANLLLASGERKLPDSATQQGANAPRSPAAVVKILDMGLARLEDQIAAATEAHGLTQSGQIMGTVDYMSPEQAEETRGVDARADQYSLGCTLWVLLTGRPMFQGTTTIAKLMAHQQQPAPSLRAARADVPEALEAIYQRMVAKEPDERFASMDEVAAALETCLGQAAPAQLDGPSSSDSALTDFLQQVAGAKTSARPRTTPAIDAETMQRQPVKEETGTQHDLQEGEAAAEPAVDPRVARVKQSAKNSAAPWLLIGGGLASLLLLIAAAGGLMWLVSGDSQTPTSPDPLNPVQPAAENYALDFDGRGSYVEIPTLQLPNGPLTVEAWITPRKTEREAIFHCGGDSFVSLHTFQSSLGFWREAPSYLKSVNNSRLVPGERIHVAGVWDGQVLRAFVNGQASGPGKQIPPELTVNKLLVRAMIGGERRNGNLAGMFDGQIDELRVSTIARYTRDFNIVAPYGRMKSDEHTLALYHFDEGTGDVLRDSSGNKHHGKILGAKWANIEPYKQKRDGPNDGLQFAGDARVELPPLPLAGLGEVCIEAWVTPREVPPQEPAMIFNADNQAGLKLFTSGSWDAIFSSGPKWHPLGSPERAVSGRRTHVAGVLQADGVRLYIDGKRVSQKPVANFQLCERNVPATIGVGWNGMIHELRVSKIGRYAQDFTPSTHLASDTNTIALYHFDEGAGDVLNDSSGHNHHGKIVGAKWVRTEAAVPPIDYALSFDGETSVDLPATIKLDATQDFTLEAIATAREVPRYAAVVGSKLQTEIILMSDTGESAVNPRWSFAADAGQQHNGILSTSKAFALHRRTHLAAVRRGSVYRLFVDGKLVGTRQMDEPLRAIDQPWRIGKAFIGEIDEVRISNTARYDSEFRPADRLATDATTVALYHCDEGAGSVLRDSSGNNHHGRIVGAKWVRGDGGEASADGLDFTADALVELPPLPIAGNSELCVEAWVTPRPLKRGQIPHVFNSDKQMGLKVAGNGHWNVIVSNGWQDSPQPAVAGRRVHVAGTLRPDGIRLYVEGKLVAHKPATNFRVGRENNPSSLGAQWDGTIDELRISKTARYAEDFVPRQRLEDDDDTLALYHFDEGAGDVLRDSSGNNHHGKIVGAKWVRIELSPPAINHALSFDGQDDIVEIPTLRYDGGPFTVELTVTSPGNGGSTILNGSGPTARLSLWDTTTKEGDTPGSVGMSRWAGGKEQLARNEFGARLDQTRLAAVFDGKSMSMYVDGKRTPHAAELDTTSNLEKRHLFTIGGGVSNDGQPKRFFRGVIDEVRISKTARYTADSYEITPRLEADGDTLALYHCDDGAGEVLRDSSGNNHHGKIVGAKWVRVDVAANASSDDWTLSFDHSDAHVVLPRMASSVPKVATIEAWVRPKAAASDNVQTIAVGQGMRLELSPAGKWKFFAAGPESKHVYSDNAATNDWTHIAGVLDGDKTVLFVNGRRQTGTGNILDPTWDPGFLLGIGGTPGLSLDDTRRFRGEIAELRISDNARYLVDFTPNWKLAVDAKTLALYHFDEGYGDVLNDSSDNNHHGKIVGATWVASSGGRESPEFAPPVDYALVFEGPSHVEIPSLERHRAEDLTIEAWVKDVPDRTMFLTAINGKAPVQMYFHAGRPSGGERLTEDDPLWRLVDAKDQVDLGAWRHLAYVIDARSARLYVDGAKVSEKVDRFAPELPRAFEQGTSIGADLDFKGQRGWTLQGQIRELRISKTARYDAAFTPVTRFAADDNTLALYHCDEGAGEVLRDSSRNNHHGKIVGAKWVRVEPPQNGTVDLLALIDLQRDALDPGMRKEDGVLLTPPWGQKNTRVAIPFRPTAEEYNIHLTAERKGEDRYGLNLGFAMGGRQAHLAMDGSSQPAWCVERIDGKSMHDGNVTRVAGKRFPLGEKVQVELQVRKNGVKVLCDGETVIDWQGRAEQLSLWDKIELPDAKSLFLVSQAEFAIYELTFTPMTPSDTTGSQTGLSLAPQRGHVALPIVLGPSGASTVEMWVTPEKAADEMVSRRLFHAGAVELKQYGRNWDLLGAARDGVAFDDRFVKQWNAVEAGRRTHLAAVIADDQVALFVNGKLIGRQSYNALPDDDAALYLGTSHFIDGDKGYQPFEGVIDEVRISQGIRYTQDFVPQDRFEADEQSLAVYHCDEGDGDTLTDASKNNRNGKIVGGTWK